MDADIAEIVSLIGDTTRANMLLVLMGGFGALGRRAGDVRKSFSPKPPVRIYQNFRALWTEPYTNTKLAPNEWRRDEEKR